MTRLKTYYDSNFLGCLDPKQHLKEMGKENQHQIPLKPKFRI